MPGTSADQLLGEMLLEAKRPAEALSAFEASAGRDPNRYRGVYGAARGGRALRRARQGEDVLREIRRADGKSRSREARNATSKGLSRAALV